MTLLGALGVTAASVLVFVLGVFPVMHSVYSRDAYCCARGARRDLRWMLTGGLLGWPYCDRCPCPLVIHQLYPEYCDSDCLARRARAGKPRHRADDGAQG